MTKRAGIAMFAVGAVLILSALLLFCYNRREDARAGQEAESLLARVETQTAQADSPENTASLAPDMPVVMLDGYGYVGYLEIPALELKLPVMAEWDYTRLKLAPCRQFGSSRTDNLVIAAHNYRSHFGRLAELKAGDTVLFTDMEGIVNTYTVAKTDTLNPDAVEAVQNSGYALTLYTCTMSGKTRTVVFCSRTTAQE